MIRLVAETANFKVTDKPPRSDKTPTKGDTVTGSDRLRNAVPQFGKAKGALVGRDQWRIVFVNATDADIRVTATLPGGTVSCRGRVDFTDRVNVIRVVGASGGFAGATGTCETRPGPSSQTTLNVYRLSIP